MYGMRVRRILLSRIDISIQRMNEMNKQKSFMLKLNMILSLSLFAVYHSLISFCCG